MLLRDLFFRVREMIEVSPAKRDRLIFVSFFLAIAANALCWLIIPIFFSQAKDYVVLQYNIYFGISSLGPWPMLFLMPLSALIVALINYSLVIYLYLKEKALSIFLAIAALSFQIVVLAALGLIIYINS